MNYNNIDTEELLELIKIECEYINSIDTSSLTEDVIEDLKEGAGDLETHIWEMWNEDIREEICEGIFI